MNSDVNKIILQMGKMGKIGAICYMDDKIHMAIVNKDCLLYVKWGKTLQKYDTSEFLH